MPPAQHQIGWFGTQFGQHGSPGRARSDVHLAAPEGEYLRVVVGAEPVGSALHQAVHDVHARRPRRGQQPNDVGQRNASCFLGKRHEPGARADDRALAFLGDDRGVAGRREFGKLRSHADAVTVGGTS